MNDTDASTNAPNANTITSTIEWHLVESGDRPFHGDFVVIAHWLDGRRYWLADSGFTHDVLVWSRAIFDATLGYVIDIYGVRAAKRVCAWGRIVLPAELTRVQPPAKEIES